MTARIAMLVLAAFFMVGLTCDEKESIFFELIGGGTVPDTGDITGTVTVDGSGRSGVTVTLRNQAGQVISTDVTDGNGNYGFLNVDPGSYTVSVAQPSGTTCSPAEKPATVTADQTTDVDFACTTSQPTTGTLDVGVLVNNVPQSGATVQITHPGGTRTGTTGANGRVRFENLDPGSYTVTATGTGITCGSGTAQVVAGQTTTADLICNAVPGSVSGQVTLSGSPASGVAVRLMQGATVVAQTTTANGNYSFANVAPGSYTVEITPPASSTCDATSKPASVTSGQNTVVNFACTPSGGGDYTVSLTSPAPGWNHDNNPPGTSVECKVITTTPAQAGATYSVVTTGPGVVTQASPGTLNASGAAAFQVRINAIGTYTNTVTVVSGGVTRMASTTVTVTGSANSCPAAPSSARFKLGVTSLLPDGMTLFGLRPVSFRYRAPYGDPGAPRIGLIAEEVARVYPGAVMLDASARPDGIWYGALNGLVLEEMETRIGHAVGTGIARLAEALE